MYFNEQKKIPFTLDTCIKDNGGRYVLIKGLLFGDYISLLNVYMPPNHPLDFMSNAFVQLAELACSQSVVGGDLHCLMNPLLDKNPVGNSFQSRRARLITKIFADLVYVDVWRMLKHGSIGFTYFSGVHKTSSRIGYFFTPKALLSSVVSCEIGNITISDHAPLYMELLHGDTLLQTGRWRFHPYLLKDHNFISYFHSEFKLFLHN